MKTFLPRGQIARIYRLANNMTSNIGVDTCTTLFSRFLSEISWFDSSDRYENIQKGSFLISLKLYFHAKNAILAPRLFFFFMLNSNEQEISTALKSYEPINKEVSCFKSFKCWIYHADKC